MLLKKKFTTIRWRAARSSLAFRAPALSCYLYHATAKSVRFYPIVVSLPPAVYLSVSSCYARAVGEGTVE